jgi:hypothetical protein
VRGCAGAQVHECCARVHRCTCAAALVLTALLAAGCGQSEEKTPQIQAAAPAQAAERPVLAESANQAALLGVQVLDVQRIAPDTVRLDLAVVNRQPAASGEAEARAVQAAVASLDGLSLVSHDGHRRVFPLRDTAGRMVWSGVETPPPGQRRQFWVCFPAPPGDQPRVTLAVPGWPAMAGVEVRQGRPPAPGSRLPQDGPSR